MGRTVYVDLFFLINFSMDFLCFFLAGKLLERKMSLPRMLIASALGGIYANVSLLLSLGGILGVVIDVAVCMIMCLIAFWRNGGVIKKHLGLYSYLDSAWRFYDCNIPAARQSEITV